MTFKKESARDKHAKVTVKSAATSWLKAQNLHIDDWQTEKRWYEVKYMVIINIKLT